ncbi:TetR/AcrR family transcriptional regulator [Nocardiopsis suaedae]|uniref:TetR/AcrR family transcriptional regulator n=1 Tax=Nocardiopsis suaedae TaxID=3018444 RepID=A0ABT4TWL0_9ACTN|nr:TetR/AcrR family transcriptional regulator [Nocardiopsis suaedae]MDA2808624.1 TetR/AcrR family transcriptional regulator [Nocardiopsis suaedae]
MPAEASAPTGDGTQAQAGPGAAAAPGRRERVREATLREIKDNARRRLAAEGPPGVSLRAIARDMGMTAPGLYRYFSGLDDLLNAVRADLFHELSAAVAGAAGPLPADDTDGRILASLRAFRSWALAHRAEFSLLFATPAPQDAPDPRVLEAGREFAASFFSLFDRLLAEGRIPLPADEEIGPELRDRLDAFAAKTGFTIDNASYGALRVLMSCWVRLYGLVSMEVAEHMTPIMGDMEPLFEAELQDILSPAGVEYRASHRP